MDQETKDKLVVVKHNDLIDAAQKLSVIESRIILTCIAKINSMSPLLPDTKFSVSAAELADLVGIDPSDAYAKIKEATTRLYQREVIFLRPSKRVVESRVRWVFQVDYIPQEGVVTLSFSPPIIKLLSEITRDFTQYKLENVLNFKGQYSFRLYELACRWGGESKIVSVSDLRSLLLMEEKYPIWKDFKKWVLEPSIAEINEVHNTSLSFEGIKKGRSISDVKFSYKLDRPRVMRTPRKKKETVVKPSESISNLEYYVNLRRRFGDSTPKEAIPPEYEAEMKEKGLW